MRSYILRSLVLVTLAYGVSNAAPPQESGFGILDELGGDGLFGAADTGQELTVSAEFVASPDGRGELRVTAELADQWHIYSVTQQPGGPTRTQILLTPSSQFEIVGAFTPDRPPRTFKLEGIYDVPVEDHAPEVVWKAPLKFAAGVDPAKVRIRGRLAGQVCREGGQCIPLSKLPTDFDAGYAGEMLASEASTDVPAGESARGSSAAPAGTSEESSEASFSGEPYRNPLTHVAWQGRVTPQRLQPGEAFTVTLRAVPEGDYHLYAYQPIDPQKISKPTVIGLTLPPGWSASLPEADREPIKKELGLEEEPFVYYYERPVDFTFQVRVPADAKVGEQALSGSLGFQTCTDKTCDRHTGAKWNVTLNIGAASSGTASSGTASSGTASSGTATVAFVDSNYPDAADAAVNTQWTTEETPTAERASSPEAGNSPLVISELLRNIGAGILGGLILNLMPCVLPVLGLKLLAFVEQAKDDPRRVLWLNIIYSAGMISVFLLLATLATFMNLSWGEQFGHLWVKVLTISFVFVMALSFLGVWEIPIPGFASGGTAQDLAAREGVQGAFFKGVFTTILATPCSGPFLGPVFAYAAGHSPVVSYTLFGSIGFGMSLPYLIVGAKPDLIRYLPKPGAWMNTFKELLAFLLLATVVYLFTWLRPAYFVPTLALLVGLWFACWWIGRVSVTASFLSKGSAWLLGCVAAGLVGAFAFTNLVGDWKLQDPGQFDPAAFVSPVDADNKKIVWQSFSDEGRMAASQAGKTVMVDFTAQWCPNCKLNLKWAIDTAAVRDVLVENQVVPMLADLTDHSEELYRVLNTLNSKSIPLLAIYPAERPDQPLILRDVLTKEQLVEALKQAGPSHRPTADSSFGK